MAAAILMPAVMVIWPIMFIQAVTQPQPTPPRREDQ